MPYPIIRLSWTPKIRDRTSGRTERCKRVRPATSTNALPSPARAINSQAIAGRVVRAIKAMGKPVTSMPPRIAGDSRRLPISTIVVAPPSSPPTPSAEVRIPGPFDPMSRMSMPRTTVRMSRMPSTTNCAPTTMVSRRCSGIVSQFPQTCTRRPEDALRIVFAFEGTAQRQRSGEEGRADAGHTEGQKHRSGAE